MRFTVLLVSTILMAQAPKHTPDLNELKKMSARFAPTPLEVDVSALSSDDKMALEKLIEAARAISDGAPQSRLEPCVTLLDNRPKTN